MYLFSNNYFNAYNNFKKQEYNELKITETKKFINVCYTNVFQKPFPDQSIIKLQRKLSL